MGAACCSAARSERPSYEIKPVALQSTIRPENPSHEIPPIALPSTTRLENPSHEITPIALPSTRLENPSHEITPTPSTTRSENPSHEITPTPSTTRSENPFHEIPPTPSIARPEDSSHEIRPITSTTRSENRSHEFPSVASPSTARPENSSHEITPILSTTRSENPSHEIPPIPSPSTTRPENPLREISPSASSENPFQEITPSDSSSIAQTQPPTQPPFDVFINHRGPDVKLTLASLIYHFLEPVGVNAFFDREELNLGDLIPQAIGDAMRNSLIHIAIFSEGYAESPWCLAELSYMLSSGAPIIPIFYYVKPTDLRWVTQGKYDQAFRDHEAKGRYESKTLEKWKQALRKASDISGYLFDINGDLGILLKKVGNRVLQEIKNLKVPFEVAKYPVGMDDAVKAFEDAIDRSAGDNHTAQIVGIVGNGGCGKTTLARELYNRKHKTYDKCSFLSEPREASLADLQKKLLEDLRNIRNVPFTDAHEGKTILAGRLETLSSLRVLIVIDDVDHVNQLDALLPKNGKSLGSGSLVIVTTRDAGVLRLWDISFHRMPALDPSHAKELFCWHAFKRESPPADFEGLVQKFITACDRLPLMLSVIAQMLYGKKEDEWKTYLRKISRLLPSEINERLRLSYKALDDEEKNIFLDVACFFIGEKKNLAIAVWDADDWSGLQRLVEKCLVEVDKQGRLRMHNHLRDLGRQIATESPLLRLWSPNQIGNIMRYTQEIRGIMAATTQFVPCPAYNEFPVSGDTYLLRFEDCMDLRFWILLKLLVVAGNHFTSNFSELSLNLVWLRWFDFEHTELPSWLSLKNLRVLELYGASKLQLWESSGHPPEELREMIITVKEGDIFDTFPTRVAGLKHLTKIALISYHGEGFRFTRLPDEFCDLQSLEYVELRHCKSLSMLPTRFGELRKLKHLDLCSCEMLRTLPESFKMLVNLEYLDLSGCEKLKPMPDIFVNIRQLKNLHFSGRPKLQELPLHIAEQKSLRELHLKNTILKNVPDNIDQLSRLETLVIGSPHLTDFPESLGYLSSLTRLKITGCIKLEALPESLGRLKLLENLRIESSGVMSLPEGIRRLTNLQYLKIIDCPIAELDFGSGSSSLGKLKVIRLQGTDVTRLSISQHCCPKLETLQLEQNYSLMEMDISSESVKIV